MTPPAHDEPRGSRLLRDSSDDQDDWAWRRRIRANPAWRSVYRGVVFTVGLVLVLGGFALVPLPGPGWFIVILGIAIWASEFEPAARLLDFVKARVRLWDRWIKQQAWWVKALVALGTAVVVATALWVVMWFSGVPGILPDGVTAWLEENAGL